ncbi:MAG TPA: hypothetical protein VFU15_02860 [Bacteroidia bacterium]|nr:hypothetical protein [Bacteroidia bacterium]
MPVKRDFDFERIIRDTCWKNKIGAIAGIVVLFLLSIFFIYFGIKIPFAPILILGLLPLGGIALVVYRFRGDLKGEDYWIDELVHHPERIAWIKPVRVQHTAYYVVTLYHESYYQLLDINGLAIMIKCNSPEDQLLFLRGVKRYTPHAHIGFSHVVQSLYNRNPAEFIRMVTESRAYLPVGTMNV